MISFKRLCETIAAPPPYHINWHTNGQLSPPEGSEKVWRRRKGDVTRELSRDAFPPRLASLWLRRKNRGERPTKWVDAKRDSRPKWRHDSKTRSEVRSGRDGRGRGGGNKHPLRWKRNGEQSFPHQRWNHLARGRIPASLTNLSQGRFFSSPFH